MPRRCLIHSWGVSLTLPVCLHREGEGRGREREEEGGRERKREGEREKQTDRETGRERTQGEVDPGRDPLVS